MGESTEEKLNLEKKILDLRREYKLSLSQVDDAKREYHSIMSSIERNKSILEEQKKYLGEVLNDISNAKLSWAIEKDGEMQKIDSKLKEADLILKKEAQFVEKEEKLKKIKDKTTDDLNETRRLQFDIDAKQTAILAKENELSSREKALDIKSKAIEKGRNDFKQHITKLISDFNE